MNCFFKVLGAGSTGSVYRGNNVFFWLRPLCHKVGKNTIQFFVTSLLLYGFSFLQTPRTLFSGILAVGAGLPVPRGAADDGRDVTPVFVATIAAVGIGVSSRKGSSSSSVQIRI